MCFDFFLNKKKTHFNISFLAYGIAGDCYMKLFELWESHYVKFVEDFNDLDLDLDFDLELEESNR